MLPSVSRVAVAQAPADTTATVRRFEGAVDVRTPAPGALRPYREDPAFDYEGTPRTGLSLWGRIWRWLQEVLFHSLSTGPVAYVLLGVAVLFAFWQFVRMQSGGAWRAAGKHVPAGFRDIEENLEEVDLAALVEEAEQAGNFRRAVRLSYLHVLRALADADRIEWNPAKTNRTYVRELARSDGSGDPSDELAALTRLFERVWYGHAEVEADVFARLRPRFDRFRRQVEAGAREERPVPA